MGCKDISAEIEKLRVSREETPAVASTISSKSRPVKKTPVKKTPDVVEEVKVSSVAVKKDKNPVSKPKKTISPEHLAKMKAGKLAKKAV
jgi:hypothetical protein